ncbi:MAG TPA: Holliday junction branch migration protein RuvA [Candidatus Manganitrophaceae bacterium]|nr:Holliday junction branch migration protein RuvA [Candidatus Manganitrophaceae bacterium]
MIASITGTITVKTPSALVVEVHGIGYQIFVPLSTFYHLPEIKEAVSLQIYTHVREDALQLYGFSSPLEKELFLLLLGISGVGPKLALNILSGMELNELIGAIRNGSVERLRAIPGVGPKTAGRLVLELKEKAALLNLTGLQPSSEPESENQAGDDALSALMNLGYNRMEAKRAIEQILKDPASSDRPDSVEGLIKKALKKLSKVN